MRPLFKKIVVVLYSIMAVAMGVSYFESYPIPGFFVRVWEGTLAMTLVLLSIGTGRALLGWTPLGRLFPRPDPSADPSALRAKVEPLLWSLAVGLMPLVLGLLGMGLAGFFSPGPIAGMTLLWGSVGAAEWRRALRSISAGGSSSGPACWRGEWFFAAFALVVGTVCAFAPPTYYDSLVYHLDLPLRYLQEGRVGFVPFNQYGHFPQNMELVFGWFLAAGSDVSAHLFNVLMATATGTVLWAMGRSSGRRWDIVLFVTAPCAVLLSTETYVEMPLAFYTALAVWAADRGRCERDRGWLVVSGLVGGFAAGIKYTGAMTPFLLTCLVVVWGGKSRSVRQRVVDGLCVAVPSFLVFTPWMIKNYVFTGGNPFFPFFPSIFPSKNVFMFAESSRAYFEVLAEYKGTSILPLELIKMPLRLLKNSQSFGGGYDVTGDLGWALPMIAAPLVVPLARRGRGFVLAYVALHLVVWASLRPVLRFLFPVFPLVCLLSGEGLGLAWTAAGPWVRRALTAGVGVFVLSNGVLLYLVEDVRGPAPVALGLVSRSEYLSKKLDYYPAMEFIDKNLPKDARVLIIGDQRGYYCPRRHMAPMGLLPTPLRPWTDESPDAAAFGKKLREMGFTHLFFNFKEAKRLEGYRVLDVSEHGREVLSTFLRSMTPLYRTEGAALFALPS